MKRLAYLLIILLSCPFIAVVMTACEEDEDCSETDRHMMWCGVYDLNENSTQVSQDTIPLLTVTAWGTDSIIVNNQEKVIQLNLPLRYSIDSTVYVFHYSGGLEKDTLIVKHKNTPYFVSVDCGYKMKHEINSVYFKGSVLDSIYLSRKDANNHGTENIKLFYRP